MSDVMSDLEWEEREDRIDVISQNGNTAEHYLDVKQDMINHPQHYQVFPDKQVIDIIKSSLSAEEFKGFLKGNFLKYRLRAGFKGDIMQDIDKSHVYRDWLFDLEQEKK